MSLKNKLISIMSYISADKVYKKPKNADILIFDRTGANIIMHYFNENDVEILDIRRESINIFVFLKMLFRLDFSLKNYVKIYCEFVKPKVIITYIDNNELFYEVSSLYPLAKTIFIQNAFRGGSADLFASLFKYNYGNFMVDYMFVHNKQVGKLYSKYISGNIIDIGSFRNNICNIGLDFSYPKNEILFISQFRARQQNSNVMYQSAAGKNVLYDDFYLNEKILLPYILNYCKKNSYKFIVCGASANEQNIEFQFYNNILGYDYWEFEPFIDMCGTYNKASKAFVIAGIDTSFTYEACVLNKRMAIFSTREILTDEIQLSFGWYADMPKKGEFWTSYPDEDEFKRVLDFACKTSEDEWKKTMEKYIDKIMEYDKGNTKFIALMKELSVPLKGEFYE